jgi:hypothetical protein
MPLRKNGDFALIISILATRLAADSEKYPASACRAWRRVEASPAGI